MKILLDWTDLWIVIFYKRVKFSPNWVFKLITFGNGKQTSRIYSCIILGGFGYEIAIF